MFATAFRPLGASDSVPHPKVDLKTFRWRSENNNCEVSVQVQQAERPRGRYAQRAGPKLERPCGLLQWNSAQEHPAELLHYARKNSFQPPPVLISRQELGKAIPLHNPVAVHIASCRLQLQRGRVVTCPSGPAAEKKGT